MLLTSPRLSFLFLMLVLGTLTVLTGCGRSTLTVTTCGDGIREFGEACDDGNTADGDGCSAVCELERPESCGDGTLDAGEECDDGNMLAGDGCDAFCRSERPELCGDSIVQSGEECDDGNTRSGDGCDATCRIESLCGNGVTEPGEQCDDGNPIPGDGCDPFCRLEAPPECGNGGLDPGEQCDDGNRIPGDGCDEFCRFEEPPFCGNGRLDLGEECDDGNNARGDGCDPFCRFEAMPFCGDEVLDPGEECDDGNRIPGDGCDDRCRIEAPPTCGNGAIDPEEECDDGNRRNGDGCDDRCRIEPMPFCGNGSIEVGEECDDGNTRPGDGCDEFCRREAPPRCGNGRLDPGEECDDGNLMSGDGCSRFCRVELMPVCGNGRVELGEECDDGNVVNGDGCDGMCRLEPPPICGDGTVDPGEQCDDGNLRPNDGCDPFCRIERCMPDVVLGTLPLGVTITRSLDISAETDDHAGCGNGADLVLQFDVAVMADVELEILQLGDHRYGLYREAMSFTCTSSLTRCYDPAGRPAGSTVFRDVAPGRYYLVVEEDAPGRGGPTSVALTVLADVPNCGNGTIDPGEACDDGNTRSGDGCSADCLSNEMCGNGVLDAAVGEACDDGNTVGGDGCSADCRSEEVCGNGFLDPGEVCDDANRRSADGCSADCQSNETCGNGYVDSAVGEQCDDGNLISGDGCSGMCRFEVGMCIVDEDLGTLRSGVPVSRRLNVAAAGDMWNTDCAAAGPERVLTFNLARAGDIAMLFDQSGHHNVGLYREGEVTDRCIARMGICAATGPDSGLSVLFRRRDPGRYFLIVEANSMASAGTADVTLVLEGCQPATDLGALRTGTTASWMGSTTMGTAIYRAGCAASVSGRERVVAFQVTSTVDLEVGWTQTGDHVLGLYREAGGACDETPFACHDPAGATTGITTFRRLDPGNYVMIVDAHDPGEEGTVSLRLTPR